MDSINQNSCHPINKHFSEPLHVPPLSAPCLPLDKMMVQKLNLGQSKQPIHYKHLLFNFSTFLTCSFPLILWYIYVRSSKL